MASLAMVWVALASAAPAVSQEPGLGPDSVAAEFQSGLRALAWRAAASRMHPEGLARFHDLVDMLVTVDTTGATREYFFPGTDSLAYASLSAADVFVSVLNMMQQRMSGLLHAIVVRDVEVVGAVVEPPDRAYAIYRSLAKLSGAESEVRVMSLKRDSSRWKVLESPELEVIREALRGTPRRLRAPN